MSKFEQFWWYIGVGVAFVGLMIAIFTRNITLTIICALVTAGLRKLQPKTSIPEVYKKAGITKEMFTPGSTKK
ncbi:hypothetical protein [Absicoccus intestinalis]|uniref:Uncharacterized protein n=1 Tax=Absicoccus intestinalis TaxID=2926319 RepID=A0ABU4WMR2_9FIRM|nr:hypothetical protein [Absicoccus sp. CLA-KB-P134]MDX8417311.1 hypothetical protein [Absicoccus sp. CLA-KB-P134]